MRGNGTLRQAAVVADRWNMDVVDVLAERDPLRWAVRVAAHMELCDLEKQEADRARR